MTTLRKAGDRGQADHGWLKTAHTFSFADYYDPENMGFRSLRVINDDVVAPGEGFGMHPHRDMEIITYILSGQLEHKDSMGNGRVIRRGEFQYMAAGTGVTHSEFNPSETEDVHLLQIWIVPEAKGLKPRYAEKSLADAPTGKFTLVASHAGRDGSMAINQDVELYLGRFNKGDTAKYQVKPQRHAWVHVAEGSVLLNGKKLSGGDALAVSSEETLQFEGVDTAQVLLFDLN